MVLTLSAEHLILAYDQGGLLISLFAAHNLNSLDQKTLCLPFLPLHYLFSLFYEKNSMWMYREIMCIGRQAMVRVFFFFAAFVAAGVLEPRDALRTMRYRGLEAMKCV